MLIVVNTEQRLLQLPRELSDGLSVWTSHPVLHPGRHTRSDEPLCHGQSETFAFSADIPLLQFRRAAFCIDPRVYNRIAY